MPKRLEKKHLVIDSSVSNININLILDKLNELIEAYNKLEEHYNQHVHYAREMQYPTSTPDNPKVY